jgi:hypothetical protein
VRQERRRLHVAVAEALENGPDRSGYSPLRAPYFVAWKDPSRARLLRSPGELRSAEAGGEITIEWTVTVVNMPLLTWPGGQR